MKKLFTLSIAIFCAVAINAQISESGNGFVEEFTYDDGFTYTEGLYPNIYAEWQEDAVIEDGKLKWELGAEGEGWFGMWELEMDLSGHTDIKFNYMFPADGAFGIWVEDAAGGGGEVFPDDFVLGVTEMQEYTIDLTAEEYEELDLTSVVEIWIGSESIAGGTFYLDNLLIGDARYTGISTKHAKSTISVYPNPAAEEFRMDANIKSLSIYNSIGQKVYSTENYLKGSPVNISDLVNGLYIINADNNIHKLMVK